MIVGVDPGLSGALFFLDPNRPSTGEAVDLPVHQLARGGKAKRELDVAGLIEILTLRRLDHAFLEQVNAMPGQGVSSMFALGKGFGILIGAAQRIPLTLVPPARWKRTLGVPKAKDGARARASQLLPAAADQWRLKKHDGRAEAALLALYGARQLTSSAAARVDPLVPSLPAGAFPLLMEKRMLFLNLPVSTQIGDTVEVTINGDVAKVTLRDAGTLVIEPDDHRKIYEVLQSGNLLNFICGNAKDEPQITPVILCALS
jgi:crossover junction endodeoxyribonuclease RuvC